MAMVAEEIETVEKQYTLGTPDIARRFNVDEATVWRWWKFGLKKNGVIVQLAGIQAGRHVRVAPEDLDEFMRLLNPEVWKAAAEEDESERKAGRKDRERLRRKLAEK